MPVVGLCRAALANAVPISASAVATLCIVPSVPIQDMNTKPATMVPRILPNAPNAHMRPRVRPRAFGSASMAIFVIIGVTQAIRMLGRKNNNAVRTLMLTRNGAPSTRSVGTAIRRTNGTKITLNDAAPNRMAK